MRRQNFKFAGVKTIIIITHGQKWAFFEKTFEFMEK